MSTLVIYYSSIADHNFIMFHRKHHTRERGECGVNFAALIVITTGSVATHGQTVDRNANAVTSWFIPIIRDPWTNQTQVKK